MGRSRGGLSTKISACVNSKGFPISFHLQEGQEGDVKAVPYLLADIQSNMVALMDGAYDANWVRDYLFERGAINIIPSNKGRKVPKAFDKRLYKKRNVIERFFGRLKRSFRRIFTRYDKYASVYLAMIKLAAFRISVKIYESAT